MEDCLLFLTLPLIRTWPWYHDSQSLRILVEDCVKTIFDATPDTHSAMVPRLTVPVDISGRLVYTADFISLEYPSVPPSPTTFEEWRGQLLHTEKRPLHVITYKFCDTEKELIKCLQLDCVIYNGTDGGKREHGGSFSWIICSLERATLVINSGPVDGWRRCQSSLRSEATALSSVCLYLDKLATFHEIEIRSCNFKTFIDSTSAISNTVSICDLISSATTQTMLIACLPSRMLPVLSAVCILSTLRVTKT